MKLLLFVVVHDILALYTPFGLNVDLSSNSRFWDHESEAIQHIRQTSPGAGKSL